MAMHQGDAIYKRLDDFHLHNFFQKLLYGFMEESERCSHLKHLQGVIYIAPLSLQGELARKFTHVQACADDADNQAIRALTQTGQLTAGVRKKGGKICALEAARNL